ncbi:hypothetical protein [Streptomyces peucetius]|uniref:Uncharacterized protein n=1 Tax=Streptomyces peucetius TaxID=1950 RepID=A0ABY6IGK9_STRPE|nr:hypothetical protein [Streptomyces peucetius]UYQ65889.1 hypothetical protein OGH68_33495 [Streptomyces peucetius]
MGSPWIRSVDTAKYVSAAPGADPWVGPDQTVLEQMLASFEPGEAPPAPVVAG